MEEKSNIDVTPTDQGKITERQDWHSLFYAQLNISLFRYLDRITIEREHVLGAEPPVQIS